jgi:hypothetical protein
MRKTFLAGLFMTILIFTLFSAGCSILRPIYGDTFHISRSKPGKITHSEASILKKKVIIAPLINMAGLKDEKAAMLTEAFSKLLKEDNTLLVTTLKGFESGRSADSIEKGITIDPALIKKAAEMGMNILVTAALEPLHYTAEKGIIWPFNKFKGEYDVSMLVNALDVTTDTVIYSFRVSEKIKMGEVPEKDKTPVPLAEETLNSVLAELQRRQSSELLEVLSNRAWRGVIARDGEKIRISGGRDIGINVGNIFDVFGKTEALKSAASEEYYVEGPKAGEIRVTEVLEDHSFAVPLGEDIKDGQIIALESK